MGSTKSKEIVEEVTDKTIVKIQRNINETINRRIVKIENSALTLQSAIFDISNSVFDCPNTILASAADVEVLTLGNIDDSITIDITEVVDRTITKTLEESFTEVVTSNNILNIFRGNNYVRIVNSIMREIHTTIRNIVKNSIENQVFTSGVISQFVQVRLDSSVFKSKENCVIGNKASLSIFGSAITNGIRKVLIETLLYQDLEVEETTETESEFRNVFFIISFLLVFVAIIVVVSASLSKPKKSNPNSNINPNTDLQIQI